MFIALFAAFVIGWSNYFGIGFSRQFLKTALSINDKCITLLYVRLRVESTRGFETLESEFAVPQPTTKLAFGVKHTS